MQLITDQFSHCATHIIASDKLTVISYYSFMIQLCNNPTYYVSCLHIVRSPIDYLYANSLYITRTTFLYCSLICSFFQQLNQPKKNPNKNPATINCILTSSLKVKRCHFHFRLVSRIKPHAQITHGFYANLEMIEITVQIKQSHVVNKRVCKMLSHN